MMKFESVLSQLFLTPYITKVQVGFAVTHCESLCTAIPRVNSNYIVLNVHCTVIIFRCCKHPQVVQSFQNSGTSICHFHE